MNHLIGISGKKQSGKNTIAKIWQLLDVWYNTEERTNFDGMMSDTQYVEYMLEDDKISYNKSSWQQKSFAHKIKQITCILLGCTMEQLEDPIFKETPLGEEWVKYELSYTSHDRLSYCNCPDHYKKYFYTKEEAIEYIEGNLEVDQDSIEISKIELTPRLLLQLLGTEFGRDMVHPNIWVNATFTDFADKEEWFRKETGLTRTEYLTKNGHSNEYKTLNKQFFKSLPKWIITDVRFFNEAEAIKDRGGILIRVDRDSDSEDSHVSENGLITYKDWNYVIDNNYSLAELILRVRQIMFKEGIIYE